MLQSMGSKELNVTEQLNNNSVDVCVYICQFTCTDKD